MERLIDYKELNYKKFEQRNDLPHKAGIYFMVGDNNLLYIGMAKHLDNRHSGHKHYINGYLDKYTDKRIYYLPLEFYNIDEIRKIEDQYIKYYNPPLNIKGKVDFKKKELKTLEVKQFINKSHFIDILVLITMIIGILIAVSMWLSIAFTRIDQLMQFTMTTMIPSAIFYPIVIQNIIKDWNK